MANFFGKDGKQLTDEELEQAVGGLTFTEGSSFFKLMMQKKCSRCGSIEFTVDAVSQNKDTVYIRCKKCGTVYDLENK